jgi:PKD repeat protein
MKFVFYLSALMCCLSAAPAVALTTPLNAPAGNMALSVVIQVSPMTCTDYGYINAEISGGVQPYTLSWQRNGVAQPALQNLEEFTYFTPGTYVVTVTDATGASASSVAVAPGAQLFSLTVSGDAPLCANVNSGNVQAFVNGATAPVYLWSNSSTFANMYNLPPGDYCVTVTDVATGCTQSDCVTLAAACPLVLTTAVTPTSTQGSSDGGIDLSVTGGTSPYNAMWSNGNTTFDLAFIGAGTYTTTVTDANGCTGTTNATVTYSGNFNSFSLGSIGQSSSCGSCNGSLSLAPSGGVPPYTYLWSNGATSSSIGGLCTGTYYVTVTDALNNSSVGGLVVTAGNVINLPLQSDNPAYCNANNSGNDCEKVCPHTEVRYWVQAPPPACGNNNGATSYIWDIQGAESYTVSQAGNEVTVVWGETGAGSVSVSASVGQLCYMSPNRCITIVPEPQAAFSTQPAPGPGGMVQVCKEQKVWFTNQSLEADLYEWYFGDDLSTSSAKNPEHVFIQPGTWTVTLVARSFCLCADTFSMQVEVLDAESPLLNCISTICPGEPVTYTTSSQCATYIWEVSPNGVVLNGGSTSSDSITVQWNDGPAATITLTALSCSGNVCPFPALMQIPILSNQLDIKGPDRVCPGSEEKYEINSLEGVLYTWKTSAGGTILEGQGRNKITVDWKSSNSPNQWVVVTYESCYLGCTGQDTLPVFVVPPMAITGTLQACENGNGTFQAKQAGNGGAAILSNWFLYRPDGSVAWSSPAPASNITPSFVYGPGIYRLVAQPTGVGTGLTCSDSAEWKIRIAPKPSRPAGIDGEKYYCPGQTYNFRALGLTPGYNVRWTVKKNNSAATTEFGNPINVAFSTGSPRWVAAAQISADELGCLSDTIQFPVQQIPAVSLSGNQFVCKGELGTYTATDYKGLNYQWEILPTGAGVIKEGQGTKQVEVFWTTPGNHTLKVNTCSQSSTFSVLVHGLPEPQVMAPAGVCPGETAPINPTGSFFGYRWKDQNGTVFDFDATANVGPGDYALVVTDANGCTGTTEFTILPYPKPNLTATTADPTGFCNNSRNVTMVALTTEDADFTYEWYKNGVPLGVNANTYTTNQYGDYSASVINQYGCKATDGFITIFPYCGGVCHNPNHPTDCPDTMTILPLPRCDSFEFKQLNAGNYMPGSIKWNFGESGSDFLGTKDGAQVDFQFPNGGKYIVVMYATLLNGNLCKTLDSVFVEAVAQFAVDRSCPGDTSRFKDVSTYLPEAQIASWAWDFGVSALNSDTTSARNPNFLYDTTGIYSARLTVTAGSGCTSSYTSPVEIPEIPYFSFKPQIPVCLGNATPFDIVQAPNIITYSWDFGDPPSGSQNTISTRSAYHKYPGTGNFVATLTVKNVSGCAYTDTQQVHITPNTLSGQITPGGVSTICEGKSINLNAPAQPGVQYLWSTGAVSQSITVNEEGIYKVTLTNAQGCTLVPTQKNVEVNPAPDGSIKALTYDEQGITNGIVLSPLEQCYGEDVNLQVFDNGTYTYTWSNGEGGDQLIFSEDRGNLLSAGLYTYTVIMTNPSTGCTAVTSPFIVDIHPVPNGFSATADQFCAGIPANLSYIGPQPPTWQLVWNTSATGPTFSTQNPGRYFVRVINEFGCTAQSNTVTIKPGPNNEAIPSGCHRRCNPDTLCIPALPDIVAWQWYFNGAPLAGASSPQLIANQSGSYYVEMTDTAGCMAVSDPLSLDLFIGTGDITGQIWADVNKNGVRDAGDTLMSNIPVLLVQNGSVVQPQNSSSAGEIAFNNIPSLIYSVQLDPVGLPPGWTPLNPQQDVQLTGCGALKKVEFLLRFDGCTAGSSSLQVNACPGSSYTYHGVSVPTGTSQQFLLHNAFGCDSTVTVQVLPLATSSASLSFTACPGSTYMYNGSAIAAGTTQQFTLVNALGCDSLVSISVIPMAPTTGTLNVTACPGSSYIYNGTAVAAGQSQQFILSNTAGCDSILTVSVAPLAATTGTLNVTACPGSSYVYNGTAVAAGQSQQFILSNTAGCDSILTVSVAPLAVTTGTLNVTACPGSSYMYNGTAVAAGQSQQFILSNAAGCDSILTVSVAPLAVTTGTLNVTACPGSSYMYNGTAVAAGQSQQFILSNTAGCDSILTVSVAPLAVTTGTLLAKACQGSSFQYQGVSIPAGQSQQIVLQNTAGCDSILTVQVATVAPVFNSINASICPGATYSYQNAEWAPGVHVFHYTSAEGCDSTLTLSISATPLVQMSLQTSASCHNQSTGALAINASGGTGSLQYALDGGTPGTEATFDQLAAGTYQVQVMDDFGCVFEQTASVALIEPLMVTLDNATLACDQPELVLKPLLQGNQNGLQFKWSDNSQQPTLTVTESAVLWLEVTNICETVRKTVQVKWADLPENANYAFVPNIFAPAADRAENAEFKPQLLDGITPLKYRFEVYNRWGEILFRTDQPGLGWDGNWNGKPVLPGVYVWRLSATFEYCGRVVEYSRTGDITTFR